MKKYIIRADDIPDSEPMPLVRMASEAGLGDEDVDKVTDLAVYQEYAVPDTQDHTRIKRVE